MNQTLSLPSWGFSDRGNRHGDSPPVLQQLCAGCWGYTFEKLFSLATLLGGTWCNFLLSILIRHLNKMLDIAFRITSELVVLFNHCILQMKPKESLRHPEGQTGRQNPDLSGAGRPLVLISLPWVFRKVQET